MASRSLNLEDRTIFERLATILKLKCLTARPQLGGAPPEQALRVTLRHHISESRTIIKGPGPRAGSSGSYVDEAALRAWTKPRFARHRSQ